MVDLVGGLLGDDVERGIFPNNSDIGNGLADLLLELITSILILRL